MLTFREFVEIYRTRHVIPKRLALATDYDWSVRPFLERHEYASRLVEHGVPLAPVLILGVSALACLVPAWRASAVNPVEALRSE